MKTFIFKTVSAVLFAASLYSCNNSPKMTYGLPFNDYKTRLAASDPSTWKPVTYKVTVPTQGVEVNRSGLFYEALKKNEHYLVSTFSNDHLLYPFRVRAGISNPPTDRPQLPFWDNSLRGSNAGRFMMGSGNTLRWIESDTLRSRLDALIDGIEECREDDGYILAYPRDVKKLRSEEPNYARSWFTHGLIEAGIAGNTKAYGLLRGHADCFNSWNELHPKLIYWERNGHQGHIASTRTYLSPVGKPEDLHIAEKYYVFDWWINELSARHDSALWQFPLENPHCYLITSFEAYLDHYIAKGDKAFLNAALGAWDLIHDKWEHTGGSIAICETHWVPENGDWEKDKLVLYRVNSNQDLKIKEGHGYPPKSYLLTDRGHTGELCGSVFWMKLNQRFHQLYPDEEKYVSEIEKSIYNIVLASQTENGDFCYHARMEGTKERPDSAINTCCEGQGTRVVGSLPEYIYSVAGDGLYVNLYEASIIRFNIKDKEVSLQQDTRFPFTPEVRMKLSAQSTVKMKLRIRIPSWSAGKVEITVNGKKEATGKPGSYVAINREWNDGDRIEFTLPMQLKTTKYTGADSIPGFDRYAVEYGPVLLAAVSSNTNATDEPVDFNSIVPDVLRPLHFNIEGDPSHRFMPYWMITDETFAVYGKAKAQVKDKNSK